MFSQFDILSKCVECVQQEFGLRLKICEAHTLFFNAIRPLIGGKELLILRPQPCRQIIFRSLFVLCPPQKRVSAQKVCPKTQDLGSD